MQVAHVLALAMFVLSLFLLWNWHISCGFISFLPHFKGQSANRYDPFHHFINQKSCLFHSSESWMYEMCMKCIWNVYEMYGSWILMEFSESHPRLTPGSTADHRSRRWKALGRSPKNSPSLGDLPGTGLDGFDGWFAEPILANKPIIMIRSKLDL